MCGKIYVGKLLNMASGGRGAWIWEMTFLYLTQFYTSDPWTFYLFIYVFFYKTRRNSIRKAMGGSTHLERMRIQCDWMGGGAAGWTPEMSSALRRRHCCWDHGWNGEGWVWQALLQPPATSHPHCVSCQGPKATFAHVQPCFFSNNGFTAFSSF